MRNTSCSTYSYITFNSNKRWSAYTILNPVCKMQLFQKFQQFTPLTNCNIRRKVGRGTSHSHSPIIRVLELLGGEAWPEWVSHSIVFPWSRGQSSGFTNRFRSSFPEQRGGKIGEREEPEPIGSTRRLVPVQVPVPVSVSPLSVQGWHSEPDIPFERGNLVELDYKPSLPAKHDPSLVGDPSSYDQRDHPYLVQFPVSSTVKLCYCCEFRLGNRERLRMRSFHRSMTGNKIL